jgi:DNA-binding protein Fis
MHSVQRLVTHIMILAAGRQLRACKMLGIEEQDLNRSLFSGRRVAGLSHNFFFRCCV